MDGYETEIYECEIPRIILSFAPCYGSYPPMMKGKTKSFTILGTSWVFKCHLFGQDHPDEVLLAFF